MIRKNFSNTIVKARILLVCKLVSKQGVSVIQCKQPTDLKSKGIEKYNILYRKTLFFCSAYIFIEISGQWAILSYLVGQHRPDAKV